jgi:hypothetical protein
MAPVAPARRIRVPIPSSSGSRCSAHDASPHGGRSRRAVSRRRSIAVSSIHTGHLLRRKAVRTHLGSESARSLPPMIPFVITVRVGVIARHRLRVPPRDATLRCATTICLQLFDGHCRTDITPVEGLLNAMLLLVWWLAYRPSNRMMELKSDAKILGARPSSGRLVQVPAPIERIASVERPVTLQSGITHCGFQATSHTCPSGSRKQPA